MADPKKVPLIIQDAERDLTRDVKKAGGIVSDLIFGNFFERHGFVPPTPPVAPPATSAPQALPPRVITPPAPAAPPTLPSVPDAEWEENCHTCGGAGTLGRKGHEVPCPVCGGCKTCGGRGKLGKAGHEIPCPVCQGK